MQKSPRKKQRPLKQLSLKKTLQKKAKKKIYRFDSPRKKLLDKLLLQMICTDFQPFSVVNDSGFITFVHALDPRYELPSPNTVSTTLLDKYYKQTKLKMGDILKSAR